MRIGTLVLVSLFAIAPAAAQSVCLSHAALTNHLEKAYAEQSASTGLGARGQLFEVFVSESGTWTIVATTPGGVSCIRAAGKSWIRVATRERVVQPGF